MNIIIFLEKILSIFFWVLIIFGFDTPYIAVLTLISAVIHELGHIGILFLIKKKNYTLPEGRIYGFRIPVHDLSYKEEIAVALAGPGINLCLALILLLIPNNVGSNYIDSFALINIMTMASNLLPISGYDGYRIIESSAMIIFSDPMLVKKLLSAISLLLCIIMCFIFLFFMLKIGEGYWLYAVFLSAIISDMQKSLK